jgi:hypothetical protein
MTQYLILIYESEAQWAAATPELFQKMMDLHGAVPARAQALGGKVVGGEALQPTTTATTIRGDEVSDGPFVETKEALGGYYLIDAPDLDTALAIGKVVPVLEGGGVEVRPIMVFDQPGTGA